MKTERCKYVAICARSKVIQFILISALSLIFLKSLKSEHKVVNLLCMSWIFVFASIYSSLSTIGYKETDIIQSEIV